jgi:hypothetical protein
MKKGRNKGIGNAVIPIGGRYIFQGRLAEVEDVSRPKATRNGWGHFRMLRGAPGRLDHRQP